MTLDKKVTKDDIFNTAINISENTDFKYIDCIERALEIHGLNWDEFIKILNVSDRSYEKAQ